MGCVVLKHHLYSSNVPRNILPPLYTFNIPTLHQPIPLRTYYDSKSKLAVRFSHNPNVRNLQTSSYLFGEPNKPSSKIEETTEAIKEKAKEATEKKLDELSPVPASKKEVAVAKKSLGQKIIDEIRHYYHGFKLLFIDIRVSSMLVYKVLRGGTLSRREYNLVSKNLSCLLDYFVMEILIKKFYD